MTPAISDIQWLEAGTSLEQHELSAKWPPMDPETFRDFAESIRADGIQDPIILYEGQVLDGWHRYNAAILCGIDIPAVNYEGDDPAGFVIGKNQLRRHMPPRERAEAVLGCRNWQPTGRPKKNDDIPAPQRPRTNDELAREAGVSTSTITRARNRQQQSGLPPDDPEPYYDEPADSLDGNGDDWEDFPDFAPPGTVGTLADDEPNDEELSDVAQESDPEPAEEPASPRRTVQEQIEAVREDELRQENADLRQRLTFIESPVEEQEQTLENLQTELRAVRSRMNDLITENEALKRENAALKRENAQLQDTLEEMENRDD